MSEVGNPGVNLVITGLFIVGGLGFAVLIDMRETRRFRRFSVHTRLILVGSLAINLIAMFLVFMLEYGNPHTLGGLPDLASKLWASWFQAVTPRTAGFNSLDVSQLTPATCVLMLLLMFIGGGPNSTASGVKVSTFLVLLMATRAFILRRGHASAFQRDIPRKR